MSDPLFQAYKAKVSELLKAKVPFGEHQRQAFEMTAGIEIKQLRTRIALLEQLLGEALRNGYIDQVAVSPSWLTEVRKAIN
jgi:hypothetical protein